MKFIDSEIHFDSRITTHYDSREGLGYGSGYCKEQNKFNRKIKRLKIFGITVVKYVMEYELVPSHVWLSTATLGYDESGWTSKWKDHPNFYTWKPKKK